MAEYVVYPTGSIHYSLPRARAAAKLAGRGARVENSRSEKVVYRVNPSRSKKKKKTATKRISAALARFLKKQNPAKMKGVTQVRVMKLKGGGVKITPVR